MHSADGEFHAGNDAEEGDEDTFACEAVHCGETFPSRGQLQRHAVSARRFSVVAAGSAARCSPAPRTPAIQAQEHAAPSREFICTVCGKGFRQKQSLSEHMLRHSEARPFACEAAGCTATFKSVRETRSHELSMHSHEAVEARTVKLQVGTGAR